MKTSAITLIIAIAGFLPLGMYAQEKTPSDSLGLPGDNLNLYAVLDLFQQSETFEIFEKKLNEENSKINNLDLNNDDKTDYIKVIDHQTGDNHVIVLQVPVTETENQDVAVIEIEKNKDGKISLQIIGNEDLYGKDYIVEPKENAPEQVASDQNTTTKTSATDNSSGKQTTNVYVTVNQWPMVQYIYTPTYVVYSSPWYWYHYPVWWKPWRPWYWHHYYWHHYHHHNHYYGWYHRTPYYRNSSAHTYYGPRRMSSATVQTHRKDGAYNKTYQGKRDKPGNANPGYQPHRRQGNYKQGGVKQQGTVKEGNIKQGGVKPQRGNSNNPINNSPNVKPQQHQPRQKAGTQPHKPTQSHQPRGGGKSGGGGSPRKR